MVDSAMNQHIRGAAEYTDNSCGELKPAAHWRPAVILSRDAVRVSGKFSTLSPTHTCGAGNVF